MVQIGQDTELSTALTKTVFGFSLFYRWDHDSGNNSNIHLAHSAAWKNQSAWSNLWTQTDRWIPSPVWVQGWLLWDKSHGMNKKYLGVGGAETSNYWKW